MEFVRDTSNPAIALDDDSITLLGKECKNLLIQIERLGDSRRFWDSRLQNLMQLVRPYLLSWWIIVLMDQ